MLIQLQIVLTLSKQIIIYFIVLKFNLEKKIYLYLTNDVSNHQNL